MKKYMLIACLIAFTVMVMIYMLGIRPFSNIDAQVEKDYTRHKTILNQFVIENDDRDIFVNKDMYDSSSESLHKIFEDLQYQFIRASHGNIFFCKGYDGMSGIGLLYSETYFEPNPKQKVIKVLDEKWMIISEHNL